MKKVFKKNIFNEAKVNEIRNYLKDFVKSEHYYLSIESLKENHLL